MMSANAVRDVTAECTLTRKIRFLVGPVKRTARPRLSPGATAAGVRASAIPTASPPATVVGVSAAPPLVVTPASATVSPRMPAATRARSPSGWSGRTRRDRAGPDGEVDADATMHTFS